MRLNGLRGGAGLVGLCGVVLLAVAGLFACRKGVVGDDGREGSKGCLAVTIEPMRFVVEKVAGEAWRVVSVVPEGYNPEDYEPTPQTLVEVADAKAYLKVGNLGFEQTWLPKLQEQLPDLRVYDTSEGLRKDEAGMELTTFDPHTWTSPESMGEVAEAVCRAMCEIDSVDSDVYTHNLQALQEEIDSVDEQILKRLEGLRHRTFVVGHPVLTYYARQYGLRQLALENHGKGPSLGSMEQLIRACKADSVKVILVQAEFNTESALTLARQIGARLETFRPLSYDWKGEMLFIADALGNGK